jgi:hypothetical protein
MPAMNVACFAHLVHTLCTIYPASVTSWIRTKHRDEILTVKGYDLHRLGLAVDVVLDDPKDVDALMKACRTLGLQPVVEATHIHIEYDDGTAKLAT